MMIADQLRGHAIQGQPRAGSEPAILESALDDFARERRVALLEPAPSGVRIPGGAQFASDWSELFPRLMKVDVDEFGEHGRWSAAADGHQSPQPVAGFVRPDADWAVDSRIRQWHAQPQVLQSAGNQQEPDG